MYKYPFFLGNQESRGRQIDIGSDSLDLLGGTLRKTGDALADAFDSAASGYVPLPTVFPPSQPPSGSTRPSNPSPCVNFAVCPPQHPLG